MTARYKDRSDWTVAETIAAIEVRGRGEAEPRFENPEYTEARREALEAAGLESEDDDATPLEAMSPSEHFQRLRRHS